MVHVCGGMPELCYYYSWCVFVLRCFGSEQARVEKWRGRILRRDYDSFPVAMYGDHEVVVFAVVGLVDAGETTEAWFVVGRM